MKSYIDKLSAQLGETISKSEEVCRQLSLIPGPESLAVLLSLSTDKDPYYRRLSAIYLGRHTLATNALNKLLELLEDKNSYVVVAAAESLLSIYQRHPLSVNEDEISASPIRHQFITMLESEVPALRSLAVKAIGNFNNKEDFDLVFGVYENITEDDQVRKAAALAAYNLASALTWRQLLEKFKQGSCEFKILACKMAEKFINTARAEDILDLTQDPNVNVRLAAYEAFHAITNSSNDKKIDYPKTLDSTTAGGYLLCDNQELNDRLTHLLKEACHVFNDHPGDWKTFSKDRYAQQLANEIKANPWLGRRMLDLKDRVISMLVYRAFEILNRGD